MSTVITRLRAIAARTPRAPALVGFDAELDFGQLVTEVAGLGAALGDAGVHAGDVVGLLLPKSATYVIALLAALHVGAAFTPLDPSLPPARLARMIGDAGVRTIVAGERERALAASLGPTRLDPSTRAAPCEPRATLDDDLAYVIFTSGSTGAPKGVEILHGGLLPLIDAQIAAFQLDSSSRSLLHLSTQFDASLSDVFTTLLAGGALHVVPEERIADVAGLRATLRERRITHVDLPPSLLRLLAPDDLADVRVVVVGGEASPPAVLRRFAAHVRLVAVYGPTEATICASLAVVDPETWERPSLGAPLPHLRFVLLPGDELGIRGSGLARGYAANPALTAERFVDHEGERTYRTGDLVRPSPDGTFEFVGRIDRQQKVRGRLIAPEEIEAALRVHPSVAEAVVTTASSAIVAHVVPIDDRALAPATALRAHLAESLPSWMIPSRFVTHASLPRTPSGKVDVGALVDRPAAPLRGGPPVGPRELAIAEIFREILHLPAIGRDDDFFALGGDSLSVLAFVAAAEAERLGIRGTTLLRAPTVALLASVPEEGGSTMSVGALVGDATALLVTPASKSRPRRPGPSTKKSVLVTGATGFLGVHVVAALLARRDVEVTTLVRAADDVEGRRRLLRALARARLDVDPSEKRLRIVVGDLARERLALGDDAYRRLAGEIDHLFHLAADVSYARDLDQLRATNVGGTARVLDLVEASGARLAHASTLDVVAAGVDEDAPGDAGLHSVDHVDGGYAQSKWAAEWLVRRAHGARVATTTIHRFGLLTASEVSLLEPPGSLFGRFLCRIGDRGVDERLLKGAALDLTPVDRAADAMVHLALSAEEDALVTHHHAARRRVLVSELVEAIRAAGFTTSIHRNEGPTASSSALLTFADEGSEDQLLAPFPYGGRATAERLAKGRPLAALDLPSYLRRLVRRVLEENAENEVGR